MKRGILFTLACIVAVTLCFSGTQADAAEAKYNWRFANPLLQPHVDAVLEKFCAKVGEYSNGQIAIKLFPRGQLGAHDESFHGVQEGSIQMAQVLPYVHIVPGGMVNWMPWTISSWAEYKLAFAQENGPKGPLAKLMDVAYAEVGLKPLFYRSQGGIGLATRVREITTPDDFKDMKFRVSGSLGFVRALANMCAGSGATFETIPLADVYNALSKGVVDSTWKPWQELIDDRHGEVLNFHTALDWAWDNAAITMNKELWDSLPDDMKQAVIKASEETQAELAVLEEKAEAETIAKVQQTYPHLKVTRLSEAQREVFRKKANMPAVWEELCKPWLDKVYPGQNMTEKMQKDLDDIHKAAQKQ